MSLKEGKFVGALDCGTTSTRFIVFDEHAIIVAQDQLEFTQHYPHSGWHEHDANDLYDVSLSAISGAINNLEKNAEFSKGSIQVVGITNQRETAIAWSRSTGEPLCRAIVWDDGRTAGVVNHFDHKINEDGIEVDDRTYKGEEGKKKLGEISGLQLSTYFSAIKLMWMIEHHPEVKKAHDADDLLFGTVESWIVYKLTGGVDGGIHITDPSNASRTLLLDINTLKWSEALLAFFGLRPSILPRIVSSSEIVGSISTGPLKGVQIGGLVGDQQGALVGNKCFHKGEAKCTYGTGAFLLFNTGHEVVRSNNGLIGTVAYQAGPETKPVYALEGSISVAGSAIKWLRDSMRLIKSAGDVNILAAEAREDAKTTERAASDDLYFVPAFSGLLAPYWDPGAVGLLIGLSSYTTPAHIALATLEANAFQSREIIEAMRRDSDVDLRHLKVDGGMTNGDTAMQVLSDIGGFEVIRPEMRESTALGAAILAGASMKLFGWDISKPETLDRVNTSGSTSFTSQLEEKDREQKWKGWKKAVGRSLKWADASED